MTSPTNRPSAERLAEIRRIFLGLPKVFPKIYVAPNDQAIEIFWMNPWENREEKIASMWWPTHPVEATEAAEDFFERIAALTDSLIYSELLAEIDALTAERDEAITATTEALKQLRPLEGGYRDALEELAELKKTQGKSLRSNYLRAEIDALRERCAGLSEALEFYAHPEKHDSTSPGTRLEFGCGCCAGTVDPNGKNDYDSSVQGLTASEALAKWGAKERCKHDVHGSDCFECYPKEEAK